MAIEWDSLVVEMVLLAVIIYGAIYVENWVEKRKTKKEEERDRQQVIQFVANDLQNKMRFLEESIHYRDFTPFFTDMWDVVILGGKQTLLPFPLFENLQHTYSWMKYYNSEIERLEKGDSYEKETIEVLEEVRKSIKQSLQILKGP
ncbi:MAG: hypothetical protein ABI347_01790 [Nitrososphaera sp.]